jgi:hypothetical protein
LASLYEMEAPMLSSHVTWLWWKAGDHFNEGSDVVAKFVTDVGQNADMSDVNIRRGRTAEGKISTYLTASHPWWHQQMTIHPNGWQGAPMAEIIRRFNL